MSVFSYCPGGEPCWGIPCHFVLRPHDLSAFPSDRLLSYGMNKPIVRQDYHYLSADRQHLSAFYPQNRKTVIIDPVA